MKKLILLPVLLGAFALYVAAAPMFSDVSEGDWFYHDVMALTQRGVIDGYGDGTFRPHETVTAAEFYKLLACAVGQPARREEGESWYGPYVSELIRLGMLPEAEPEGPVSKIAVALLLDQYYPDLQEGRAVLRLAELFEDYEDIPQDMALAAMRMCRLGMIIGSGGRYEPHRSLTRAEAATVIARVLAEERRKPIPLPSLPVDGLKAAETSGQIITVTVAAQGDSRATVHVYELVEGVWLRKYKDLAAVVGSRGVMKNRRQNTYTSPVGNYGFVYGFGARENPGMNPGWEYREITEDSYWVLDSESPLYNRWSEGKGSFRDYEHLIDFGDQYHYAMVIDFNYYAPVKGDGGGIFMHVATRDGKGTAGCVGLSQEDLLNILRWLDPEQNPRIIICVEGELGEY